MEQCPLSFDYFIIFIPDFATQTGSAFSENLIQLTDAFVVNATLPVIITISMY